MTSPGRAISSHRIFWGNGMYVHHMVWRKYNYTAKCFLWTCTLQHITLHQTLPVIIPYSGKFSGVLIFTVFADQFHSMKIKTSKFQPTYVRIRKHMAHLCVWLHLSLKIIKMQNVWSDQSVKIFTLKNFPLYGIWNLAAIAKDFSYKFRGFQSWVLVEKTLFFKHSYPPQKMYVCTYLHIDDIVNSLHGSVDMALNGESKAYTISLQQRSCLKPTWLE